jgi:hypothetical protein
VINSAHRYSINAKTEKNKSRSCSFPHFEALIFIFFSVFELIRKKVEQLIERQASLFPDCSEGKKQISDNLNQNRELSQG